MTSEIKDAILTIPIRTFLSALSTRLYSLVFLCFIYPVYDRYIFEEKCKLPDGGGGNLLFKNSVVGWGKVGFGGIFCKVVVSLRIIHTFAHAIQFNTYLSICGSPI